MLLQLSAAFIVSLFMTLITAVFLIPALRRANAGQSIREDGPIWHSNKEGTPIMGGLAFIAGTTAACIIVGFREIVNGELNHIYILLFALVYAAIGFLDDYQKLRYKRNLGLKASHKFLLHLVIAMLFVFLMHWRGSLTLSLYIPFFNVSFTVPILLYYVFGAFIAVGTVNAVNITDGIDGLATGTTIPVTAFFILIALLWKNSELGIYAAALTGGLIAFLLFNFHPAKVFMGDTGAQFLGGSVCALAFACDMPLILVTLGIVYIIETLSDIIQVTYYKATHGKRVFKMAPLHHHFEMCGWSEYLLFAVFTGVSAIFAVISYFGVRFRY